MSCKRERQWNYRKRGEGGCRGGENSDREQPEKAAATGSARFGSSALRRDGLADRHQQDDASRDEQSGDSHELQRMPP
jgi:hypothetical protein